MAKSQIGGRNERGKANAWGVFSPTLDGAGAPFGHGSTGLVLAKRKVAGSAGDAPSVAEVADLCGAASSEMHELESIFSAHHSTVRELTSKLLNQFENIFYILLILIAWKSRSTHISDVLRDESSHHSEICIC